MSGDGRTEAANDIAERAWRARQAVVVTLKCKECRKPFGAVFDSPLGWVAEVHSAPAGVSSDEKRRRAEMKEAGQHRLAKALYGTRTVRFVMASGRPEVKFRCQCSDGERSLDWSVTEAGMDVRRREAFL